MTSTNLPTSLGTSRHAWMIGKRYDGTGDGA